MDANVCVTTRSPSLRAPWCAPTVSPPTSTAAARAISTAAARTASTLDLAGTRPLSLTHRGADNGRLSAAKAPGSAGFGEAGWTRAQGQGRTAAGPVLQVRAHLASAADVPAVRRAAAGVSAAELWP